MNFTTERDRLLFELDEARHRYRVAREDCERAFAALRRLDPHFEAECPGCSICESVEKEKE